LYAVGNDMSSIMGGNYPGGGITLGPAMVFGYIAGYHLAAARWQADAQLAEPQTVAMAVSADAPDANNQLP
jgi:succinate dehydrogenase/fumarate reductase flavoprotein subunit